MKNDWLPRFRQQLSKVWDKEYQRRSWFGLGDEINGPSETLIEIFDGLYAREVVEKKYDVGLEEKTLQRISAFLDAFDKYAEPWDGYPNREKVFNDPKWDEIRNIAFELDNYLAKEPSL